MSQQKPASQSRPALTDWPRLMAFGFGVLRLSPHAFWSLTPRELDAAMRGVCGEGAAERAPVAPSREDFNGLMQRFPDSTSQ